MSREIDYFNEIKNYSLDDVIKIAHKYQAENLTDLIDKLIRNDYTCYNCGKYYEQNDWNMCSDCNEKIESDEDGK